jgi:antitoxin component YwqK of YwqJK toxin-antitoxin module
MKQDFMQDKINQRNATGNKHGCWEEYWANGDLWYKGNFKHGVPHGSWIVYWANDFIHYKGSYINGQRVGYWEENYPKHQTYYYAN